VHRKLKTDLYWHGPCRHIFPAFFHFTIGLLLVFWASSL
jgi:hypothetical protein